MNKRFKEKGMQAVFFISALISIVCVLLICVFLLSSAWPAFREIGIADFLFGTDWSPVDVPASFGILPMILGSVYVTAGAIVVGVPIGVFTAIYMAKFCPQKIYKPLKASVDLLAGIPSVVYGFFGLAIIVPFISDVFGGTGSSILTASILLGIMILPTIISISEAAIRAVPQSYYEGALALGATHERAVFGTTVKAAMQGIFSSIVLGIGRAIGETMAVVMVAGNQARMPVDLLKGVRTLTTNIALEMGYAAGLHRNALIATAVVLFIFILAINISLSLMKRRKKI